MKKIIFSAAILALAAIGAIKATETNNYAFNELQMENIEMLAQGEIMITSGGLCDIYCETSWFFSCYTDLGTTRIICPYRYANTFGFR